MGIYAAKTVVSPEKSKMEIEQTLKRYGAQSFASGWSGDKATIIFEAHKRRVRFTLPLPDRKKYYGVPQYEQAVRQRWRALALAIKAKLEVVDTGISTFEEEFLAHIVLPDGSTAGEWLAPQIQNAYDTRAMPPLLGSGK